MSSQRYRWLTTAVVSATCLVLFVGVASAQTPPIPQHGISFTKGCVSPTSIGSPYQCGYTVENATDDVQDTLRITSIVDTVLASGGAVSSGNLLPLAQVTITTEETGSTPSSATCVAVSGNGIYPTPYLGVTSCTLPFGSVVHVLPYSHYTVVPGDFTLPGGTLPDSAVLTWQDLCDKPAGQSNCNPSSQPSGAASLSVITKASSSTSTLIHDGSHAVVTTVPVGTTVHDFVRVTGQPGLPAPTGNITLDWFLNGDCSGSPSQTSGPLGPLNASGELDATGFEFTVNSPGFRSFKAHFAGDGVYNGSDGDCEPLRVVDANIQINPPTANNPVGTNHTLTGHVNVDTGGGFVNAPAGTAINFSIVSGPGSFVSGINSCTTIGATGSCTVQITSATTGTTVVKAATDVVVNGQSLHRETDATGTNSGPASKNWADDTIVTHVRDAANNDVTNETVGPGTVVHDEATVAKAAGTPAAVPNPTGTVTFTLYASGTCTGTVVATDANKPLNASGLATSANFTTPSTGGSFSYLAHYNGDANYPARDAACEPFTVETPPGGLITHTNVACEDVLSGDAVNSVIDAVNYPSSRGNIGQGINPGKFFFWSTITTTVPNQVVTVTQTNTSTNNAALFQIHQGWARIYTGNCASWKAGTEINGGSGASFTVPTPGTYIIGIKYDPKSLAGTKVPVPPTVTYSFATSLGGTTGATVLLQPEGAGSQSSSATSEPSSQSTTGPSGSSGPSAPSGPSGSSEPSGPDAEPDDSTSTPAARPDVPRPNPPNGKRPGPPGR
jgi:hypothetical protein